MSTQLSDSRYRLEAHRGAASSGLRLKLTASLCAFGIATGVATSAFAANAAAGAKKSDPAEQAATQATQAAAIDAAKGLAKNGNLASAEAKLGAVNRAKPATAAWHIELAQRLVQVADRLARDGAVGKANATATQAMQHLDQADRMATDAVTHVTAKSLTGFIQERYLGDTDGAIASYKAAADLEPKATAAAEAADRLTRTRDTARGRESQPKK